jgi:hypothetical protein
MAALRNTLPPPPGRSEPLPVHTPTVAALPCPECRMRGHEGLARIGNRRSRCAVCNTWAANLVQKASRRLRERHPDEYRALVALVEADMYPQVIEEHTRRHPVSLARFDRREIMQEHTG